MPALDESLVKLGLKKPGKDDAIRQSARIPASRGADSKDEGQIPHAVDVMITGHLGLSASAATEFSRVARRFQADIRLRFAGKTADGKSVKSLLMLAVESRSVVRILTRGEDAEAALSALENAVASGLNAGTREEDADRGAEGDSEKRALASSFTGDLRRGVSAAPGIAIAAVFVLEKSTVRIHETAGRYQDERNKLLNALIAGRGELQKHALEVSARVGSEKAAIFLAHQEIIDDGDLLEEANEYLKKGLSAGIAFKAAMDRRADELSALDDEGLAERIQDVREVLDRVLRLLAGDGSMSLMKRLPSHPVILLVHDLAPSEAITLDPKRVVGLVTIVGGPMSHAAILARTLGIPSVVGLGQAAEGISTGMKLIVDGDTGSVVIDPNEADRILAKKIATELADSAHRAKLEAYRPAYTSDGHRLEAVANVGSVEEGMDAIEAGAEGIGLLRTEFLFLKRDDAPNEEEQFQALLKMSQALQGLPLIVRTLDVRGDKELFYLRQQKEENPSLDVRGIRFCLEQPELFTAQLRAILRVALVSVPGAVKVMFPMIATVEEFIAAKALLEQVRKDLDAPPIECGIMIEVPSAVMIVDRFAEVVDFFSIGTDDLTQYLLAMDRLHPSLAAKADALHPAVLRMIKLVVDAAHAKGRSVGVCGNLAAERSACPILIGLGVDELSVNPAAIAALKARIRDLTMVEAKDLAQRALVCHSSEELRALIRNTNHNH